MRRLIVLALLSIVACATLCQVADAITVSGGSVSGGSVGGSAAPSGELFNDPTANIFDTYDPLCDGSNTSTMFCDGFEDATYIVDENVSYIVVNDYWTTSFFSVYPDPFGRNYTECNYGTINSSRADFGAAGTPCTATAGYNNGDDPAHYDWFGVSSIHRIAIEGTDPNATRVADGPMDIGFRFYFREVGVESVRCAAGWPNCPVFNFLGAPSGNGNGYKFIEFAPTYAMGGIKAPLVQTWDKVDSVDEDRDLFGIDSNAECTSPTRYDGQDYPTGTPLPYLNHVAIRGHWIFMEVRMRIVAGDHEVEMWMDDCGFDGRGCTGTPTKVIDSGAYNSSNTCQAGNDGLKAVWANFYSGGVDDGEFQFDEIVVRDRTINNTEIGFAPVRPAP